MPKILILEDESNLAELLKDLLSIEGHEVRAPQTFDTVMEGISEFGPDAIVMDIHLEEVDGLELIESIRRDPNSKDLYILALSGMSLAHEAREAGANAFLQKPFMPDEIINQLNQTLNP